MVLRLFKKEVGIELATDRTHYLLGETVSARLALTPAERVTVERATVELVCSNEYEYRVREYDSSDGRWETERRRTTATLVVAARELLSRVTLEPGQLVQEEVGLEIPAQSSPSGEGSITKVRWKVRARLEVPRSVDPKATAPITVLSPPSYGAAWAHRPPIHRADDCAMAIEISGPDVSVGSRLVGTVTVTPFSNLKARRVRMRFERYEEVPEREGNTSVKAVAKVVLAEDVGALPERITQRYPFAIDVPADACPSLVTEAFQVRWRLVAEVDRKLRRDEEVEVAINLYSAAHLGPA